MPPVGGGAVFVVGDLMVDVVVAHDEPVAPGSDTPARITVLGGGSGANTACWLGSVGRATCFGGSVGDDPLGQGGAATVGRWVATRLAVTPRATGTCVVLVDRSGQRTMFPDRGANDALGEEVVRDGFAADPAPSWFHLSAYALLGRGSRPAARLGLELAIRAGVPSSVDAASAAPLRAVGADRFLGWIDGADLLFANEEEAEVLGGEDAILARVGQLVTKLGPAGARWSDGATRHAVPAVAATVVDTTGAGDAFAAGYLDAILREAGPAAGLAAGAALAARAVGVVGGRPPEPAD